MREGPLAALFRKTAQDVDDRPGAQPAAPEPAPAAEEPTAVEPEPHAPREPEVEEPRIPLPHERLRHAFSADIPENVLEPPAAKKPVAPEPDVYAHALGTSTSEDAGPARTLGLGPVLRVVGVGGAGVNAIN
ncbi:MAG TPA: cell division protein FtsZ, partial [Solirubrobacteraceae bacterium]